MPVQSYLALLLRRGDKEKGAIQRAQSCEGARARSIMSPEEHQFHVIDYDVERELRLQALRDEERALREEVQRALEEVERLRQEKELREAHSNMN